MIWNLVAILAAFTTPVLHAGANLCDGFLSNRVAGRLSTLILLSTVANILFLPAAWIIQLPHALPIQMILGILPIAVVEVAYQFFYYRALQQTDTSVVVALFSLGKLTLPVLAFVWVGEQLTIIQYVGYFVIIISAVSLAFDPKKFRFNHAAWLMLIASVLLSIQSVAYKWNLDAGIDWVTIVTWSAVLQLVISMICWISNSRENVELFKHDRATKLTIIAFAAQALTWVGEQAGIFALSRLPVSIVSGIEETQALFAVMLAAVFAKWAPGILREQLEGRLYSKIISLIFMLGGALIVLFAH